MKRRTKHQKKAKSKVELVKTWTTAIASWDSFDTRSLGIVGQTARGTPVRLVETPATQVWHQRCRYSLARYFVADEHEWRCLLAEGLAIEDDNTTIRSNP
jgi:hypothetical protein